MRRADEFDSLLKVKFPITYSRTGRKDRPWLTKAIGDDFVKLENSDAMDLQYLYEVGNGSEIEPVD